MICKLHTRLLICVVFVNVVFLTYRYSSVQAESNVEDPLGVSRKPIPDKLIVLTFDDAPASHATVVAPILKKHGFGGSFYVCDFDSFRTRKDWYLTYRQMKAMADNGFEIGNHSLGHYGALNQFLAMEDQMMANHVPKPTTVCWPVYDVNRSICGDLGNKGYTFGRGGHQRPYRPTVDDPFDVPSFSIQDGVTVEKFAEYARQACEGRVVVFCFHGVPDMEHPSVGLDPETFKLMMQYLKDNEYTCIALRDMDRFIHPVRAAKLPPTSREAKNASPVNRVKELKPYIGKDILQFTLPGGHSARISGRNIKVEVPLKTDITSMVAQIKITDGAKIEPPSGTKRDFTKPQAYTVTARDGTTALYTVSVTINSQGLNTAKEILSFQLPGATSVTIAGNQIGICMPVDANLKLTPKLTLSPQAKLSPEDDLSARDFAKPQSYTVVAQDGSTKNFVVNVVKGEGAEKFTWNNANDGNWSDSSKWVNGKGLATALGFEGNADLTLNFNKEGVFSVNNDLAEHFLLNQLQLGPTLGLKLNGNKLSFVRNPKTGINPSINVHTRSERDQITIPVELKNDLAVSLIPNGRLTLAEQITGPGGIIIDNPGTDGERYSNWGYLRIDNKNNTYSGGTTINSGQLFLFVTPKGAGTGPVTLNQNGSIRLESVRGLTNPLILNGGTIDGGGDIESPITLQGNTKIAGNINFNQKSGSMSGPGGFTQIGTIGAFGRVNNGDLYLWGRNTYTGPTTVHLGKLHVKKLKALYDGDPTQWIPAKISIHPSGTLVISAGGVGEFTGQDLGKLLTNLTTNVRQNGLMAGSYISIDVAKESKPVSISTNFGDSKGVGGGSFTLKKVGAGVLKLTGNNSYTGRTILENGTLEIDSLNTTIGGKPTSSLGSPKNVEDGEIVIGVDGQDGDCAIIYHGKGETSDRVLNFAGKKATITIDQAGSGLLKFSNAFLMSGYGADNTIHIKAGQAGQGEIAGNLFDPHDRLAKAATAVIKSGKGTWTLSGTNTYSGPTTIQDGTLAINTARSLGKKTQVSIDKEAKLALNFSGEVAVRSLIVGDKKIPAGKYDSKSFPEAILGEGVLNVTD